MSKAANDGPSLPLQVSDSDLTAYAAGGLPSGRRRAVEGFLAANPDLAARVMTQMHLAHVPRRVGGRRGWVIAALGVAVLACAGSALGGWTAAERRDLDGWREADGDDPPDFVEDSAESRQASRLRASMPSQVETPQLNASEIRQTLHLPLPTLPATWRIRDVQVFPTDDGPGVNIVVDTPNGSRLEFFAVREKSRRIDRPEIARRGREAVAFWSRGDAAYVLSGSRSIAELMLDASALAQSAYL